MRNALTLVVVLVACQADLKPEIRRSKTEVSWVTPGEQVTVNGLVRSNNNDAYGAPFVMVWEGYADLDPEHHYAIDDGELVHDCGEDAAVTQEYALVTTANDLTIARSFQGVRGFDKIPAGVLRLQALVFANKACRVEKLEFTIRQAVLADKSPQQLCEEKEDSAWVDDECVPRLSGPAPDAILASAWRQTGDGLQWIFQFDEDGKGIFGFKSGDLTVQSGDVETLTDHKLTDSHILVSIGDVEDIPADSLWQENSTYYCRLRLTDGEPRQMEWDCAEAGATELPAVSSQIITFEEISAEDTNLSPE